MSLDLSTIMYMYTWFCMGLITGVLNSCLMLQFYARAPDHSRFLSRADVFRFLFISWFPQERNIGSALRILNAFPLSTSPATSRVRQRLKSRNGSDYYLSLERATYGHFRRNIVTQEITVTSCKSRFIHQNFL